MIESLSDEQLLQLANNYITTDESLKKFQNFNKSKEQTVLEKEKSLKEKLESINKLNMLNSKSKEKENSKKTIFKDNNLKFVSDGEDYKNQGFINQNNNNNNNINTNNVYNENKNTKSGFLKVSNSKLNDKVLENPDLSLKNKDNVMKALNYYNNTRLNKKK